MKEATLYIKKEKNKLICTACKHKCIIPNNQTGICGVRQNKDGKLYLLVYGKASAVNVDPIEKKPLYHFLPGTQIFSIGTVGCNFSCSFCQNWDLSQCTKDLKKKLQANKHPELMDIEVGRLGYELPPKKIVEACIDKDIPAIAYTYNEPTIFFEYLYDTAKLAKDNNIKNVMVTNGYESDEAMEKLKGYIDAMNIDLKAFTDEFYQKLSHAKLKPVLETIKKAHKLGIWIEITTLLIPKKNDSDKELSQIAKFVAGIDKNIPWHVTAFHPDFQMTDLPPTSINTLVKAYEIGKKAGLKFVYVGNVIDEKHSNTYCPKCNSVLIRRAGFSQSIENLEKGYCKKCKEKIPGIWS